MKKIRVKPTYARSFIDRSSLPAQGHVDVELERPEESAAAGLEGLVEKPHRPGQQGDRIGEVEVDAHAARAEDVLAGLDVRGEVDLLEPLDADVDVRGKDAGHEPGAHDVTFAVREEGLAAEAVIEPGRDVGGAGEALLGHEVKDVVIGHAVLETQVVDAGAQRG